MIVAIGVDFVAVRAAAGADVLLAIRAVGVVRTAPAVDAAMGDRAVSTDLRLADVLVELATDRERVRLVTSAGETLTGSAAQRGP